MDYLKKLEQDLPLLGHRNWILIVDKAYPLQSSPGMSYMNSNEELFKVLKKVLHSLRNVPHIRPIVYVDKELEYMDDSLSIGVESFKLKLRGLLSSCYVKQIPHEEIFSKLDEAARLFNIVVIKTESLIPYTSVFIELDCGYWSEEKQEALQNKMKA